MNETIEMLNRIPIRHDWISMIILCGWVQGFFLSLVFVFRSYGKNRTILLFGILLFFFSALLCDGYLCYTGLMKYVIHLNDSTEVFVLLIGPCIYLFIKSIITKEKLSFSTNWKHLGIPLLYFLIQIPYFISPEVVKLNAYLNAYFPYLGNLEYDYSRLRYIFYIKDEFRWFILFSLIGYIFLSAKIIVNNKSKFTNTFWKTEMDKYNFSNFLIVFFVGIFLIILVVFLNHETDSGDHIISIFLSIIIYMISFFILVQSKIFDRSWIGDKYDTSGLQTNHQEIFRSIQTYFNQEKYFLQTDASLKDLSEKLNQPANYISQSINQEAQQNFNEFLNTYRIKEVKTRLGHADYANLNIVGIGQSVGFKSKSAFYAAFRKQTNMTPSQFLEQQKK